MEETNYCLMDILIEGPKTPNLYGLSLFIWQIICNDRRKPHINFKMVSFHMFNVTLATLGKGYFSHNIKLYINAGKKYNP